MTDTPDPAAKPASRWKSNLIVIAVMVPWTVGWIVLMNQADFPKSFGFSLGRGKGALIVAFFYSYLLVQRHNWWDIALFVWMWGPLLGGLGWLLRKQLRNLVPGRFSLFDEGQ